MDRAGAQKFSGQKPRWHPATSGTRQRGARILKIALTPASQPPGLSSIHPSIHPSILRSSLSRKAGVDFAGASSDNGVHRARLATAIHVHKVKRILTFNDRDFPCGTTVEAWHPEAMLEKTS